MPPAVPTLPLANVFIANTMPDLLGRINEVIYILNNGGAGGSANALFANSAAHLDGKTEGNLNVNSAVTALTANNALHVNGKTEGNLNVNSAAFATAAGEAATALLANNALHLNGKSEAYFTNATNLATGTVPSALLPVANSTVNGVVSTTTQAFAGVKTFLGNVVFSHVTTFNEQVYGSHFVEFASSNTTSLSFDRAPLQIRESARWGNSAAIMPRIAFHHGNIFATQIGLEANGTIAILDGAGSSYAPFKSSNATFTGLLTVSGNTALNGNTLFSANTQQASGTRSEFLAGAFGRFWRSDNARRSDMGHDANGAYVLTNNTGDNWEWKPNGTRALFFDASGKIYERTRTVAQGDPITFTPTLGGITIGNGSIAAEYTRIGRHIFFTVMIVMGSTTSFPGGILTVNAPTAYPALAAAQFLAEAHYYDSDTANQVWGRAVITGGLPMNLMYMSSTAAGAAMTIGYCTNTTPWTWAQSDQIYIRGWYRETA